MLMKRLSVLLVVAIVCMIGCNDTAKTPDSGASDSTGEELVVSTGPPEHRMDLEGIGIPDVPIVAQIDGMAVKLNGVQATRTPDGTDASTGLTFNVGGKILTIKLPQSSVVHTDKKWAILKPSKSNEDYEHLVVGITGKAHYYHSFVIRLELGKPVDGKLPGRVYLCLPDEEKSFIAGKFEAELPEQ